MTKITCIRCEESVDSTETYVDNSGQFPKLNIKAQEEGKEKVELCNDCYTELTGEDEEEDLKEEISDVRNFL